MKLYSKKHNGNNTTFGNDNRLDNRYEDRFSNRNNQFSDRNGRTSTTEIPFGNETQMYESFSIFESIRYGTRLNLMFQVSFKLIHFHQDYMFTS